MTDLDTFYQEQQPSAEGCWLCENTELAQEAKEGLAKGYPQRLVLQYIQSKGFPWRSRDKMMDHIKDHADV